VQNSSTFQMVLTSNGIQNLVIFHYGRLSVRGTVMFVIYIAIQTELRH